MFKAEFIFKNIKQHALFQTFEEAEAFLEGMEYISHLTGNLNKLKTFDIEETEE